jgi:outer membrane biosynthesis protein TonB
MNTEDENDPFTEELRLDLPSPADDARVRARLISAGLLAGASVVIPGAATAAAAPSVGLFSKLVALPLLAKVGAGVAVATLASVPIVAHVARDTASTPRALATVTPAAPPPTPKTELVAAAPAPMPAEEPSVTQAPEVAPRTQAAAREPLVQPVVELPIPTRPSVGSFAPAPAPVDEGTLRAETALMEHALAALQRGDVTTARRGLAAHAAQYPNGHLAPERQRALERMLEKETKP